MWDEHVCCEGQGGKEGAACGGMGHRSGGGRGRVIDGLPAEDCLQGYEQLPGCRWMGGPWWQGEH